MGIKLTSPSFSDGEMLDKKFACDGENVSPALKWENLPEGTRSIAIICEDPDAPMGTFVHWVIYDIAGWVKGLEEGIADDETLENGIRQGINDFGDAGYGGPCPPSGTHRYFFKIYALDKHIDSVVVMDKDLLLEKMQGHVLGEGQLIGKYQR